MTTFTIDPDNNITAFAHPQEAEAAASGESFASQEALDTLTTSWPMDRFVTIWNSFAGVAGFGADLKPVKKFENRDKAVARIWKALQRLNGDATPEDAPAAETATVHKRCRAGSRTISVWSRRFRNVQDGQYCRLRSDPEARFHYGQDRAKIVDFALEKKGVAGGILEGTSPSIKKIDPSKKFKKTKDLREGVLNGSRVDNSGA